MLKSLPGTKYTGYVHIGYICAATSNHQDLQFLFRGANKCKCIVQHTLYLGLLKAEFNVFLFYLTVGYVERSNYFCQIL